MENNILEKLYNERTITTGIYLLVTTLQLILIYILAKIKKQRKETTEWREKLAAAQSQRQELLKSTVDLSLLEQERDRAMQESAQPEVKP